MTPNPRPPDVDRLAGGRRQYAAGRRKARERRRERVRAALLASECPRMVEYGWAARLARKLGVHHSQISRDLAAIRPTLALPDPCCPFHALIRAREEGHVIEMDQLEAALLG